jgi:uncharacterized membrane protein
VGPSGIMRERPQLATIVLAVGAVLGLVFASVSTSDFAMHLDRQVHDVHCSFVPGLSGPDPGESGCQVTLVSPYSSVFRSAVWGGVPISLPAMGVFAFLLFFVVELVLSGRQRDPRATGFLALATALPALTSMVMAYISLVELDAVCKLCIGIYLASALSLGGGLALWLRARKHPDGAPLPARIRKPRPEPLDREADPAWVTARSGSADEASPIEHDQHDQHDEHDDEAEEASPVEHDQDTPEDRPRPQPVSVAYLGIAFAMGLLFVATPVAAYLILAPDHSRFVGTCGALPQPDDTYGVMIPLAPRPGAAPAIEILDPLCPACRGFEERLDASGLASELDRRALLFPLDNTCNWMVDSAVHPGACAVSEAMLCAGDRAADVLAWAFDHQERIRAAASQDPTAAARMVSERFPALAGCVGSPKVRSQLNRSLRWAVSNQLPVLTPQLYVGGVKLCDEDVDLGLEFALTRMLSAYRKGALEARDLPGDPAVAGDQPDEEDEALRPTRTPDEARKPPVSGSPASDLPARPAATPEDQARPSAGEDGQPGSQPESEPKNQPEPGPQPEGEETTEPEPRIQPEPRPQPEPAPEGKPGREDSTAEEVTP